MRRRECGEGEDDEALSRRRFLSVCVCVWREEGIECRGASEGNGVEYQGEGDGVECDCEAEGEGQREGGGVLYGCVSKQSISISNGCVSLLYKVIVNVKLCKSVCILVRMKRKRN